ncbi:MAG: DUF4296 domain-containing protein [Dysgonamonadaceae bacterium]|jgi:uncharacterized protein YcfL|nr:DUF4296 domain-containing protein [Dysgonamonadaceae bacterium]
MRSRSFAYLFLILFAACTGKPAYVLSDKKMENVLFDLYIAETEINENSTVFRTDSAKMQNLLQSVFKKHKISQAKFDTSLVWYNAHVDRYMKINTQLTERYGLLIEKLQAEIDRQRKPLSIDTIQFEDLKLKDFATPFLFPWLPEDSVDSTGVCQKQCTCDSERLPAGLEKESLPTLEKDTLEKNTYEAKDRRKYPFFRRRIKNCVK